MFFAGGRRQLVWSKVVKCWDGETIWCIRIVYSIYCSRYSIVSAYVIYSHKFFRKYVEYMIGYMGIFTYGRK